MIKQFPDGAAQKFVQPAIYAEVFELVKAISVVENRPMARVWEDAVMSYAQRYASEQVSR